MTRPTPRPTRTSPRRARLTAGIAGLSLAAGSVAGVIAAAGGGSATVAAPAPTGAPPTTVAGPTGASGSAPAAAPTTDATTDTAATGTGRTDWDAPAASVTAAPASVVGDVAANQPVRIVTVRSVDGRPSVVTTTVTGRASATAAVAAAQRDATTVSVGVDRVLRLAATSDDPRRAAQWALTTLRAEQTWTATTGNAVTVAVVDTGVQASHPDLAGSVLSGVDLVRDDPKSIDGSKDENGHGTHVAGIIAAVANNRIGVAGLAPGAKILPVRVLDGDGAGYDSDIADGIVRAVDRGATVVNLSIGGTEAGATSYAVRYALSKNVVVVAAAGNEREEGNPVSYPAADAGVIGVAATDWSDTDAPFSNTGDYVDVAAPGVGIWSTYRGSTYKQLSGTSMATPYVAAAAALIRAVSPGLTPAAVGALLERTATDLGAVGRDDATGHGLVDPYAAVCSLVTCGGSTAPTAGPTGSPTSSPTTSPTSPTTSPSPSTSPTAPASPVATAFRVTKGAGRPVVAGTSVSLQGTLTVTRTGAQLGSAPAEVCVRTAPAATFRCTATTTSLGGVVAWNGTPTASTWVYLNHPATATTKASRTATVAFPVVSRVTLRAGTGTVTATVGPAAGQVVKLDRLTGKTWTLMTGKTVSRAGQASFTKLKAGTYRVRIAATSSTVASTSSGFRVR